MNKISVVIVTFNNIPMLKGLLSDLKAQTRLPEKIFVVDNASIDSTQTCFSADNAEICYIRLAKNTGSSGGYYTGLKAALPESDLILTLDDDLHLEKDMLEELEKGFEQSQKTGKVAAVRAVVLGSGQLHQGKFPAFAWRGTLFNASAIKEVGLPADDFFIYGEEIEYSLRLNKAGYSFYWVPSSRYSNPRIGDKQTFSIFGRTFMYYTETPRLYYAFRNEFFVYLKYGCFLRALRVVAFAVKVIFWMVCFDRKSFFLRTKAILLGLYHGARGKRGKVL